jgi:hypothetical protein
MTSRPPPDRRLLELLSAYLDGQLSAREKSAVEKRLQEDAGLRLQLEELREIRTRLRSLPLLRAPRDFRLDPALGRIRGPRGFPSWPMALGSAVASVALLLLLAYDWRGGVGMASDHAAFAPAEAPQAFFLESGLGAEEEADAEEKLLSPTAIEAAEEEARREAEEPAMEGVGEDAVALTMEPAPSTADEGEALPEEAAAEAWATEEVRTVQPGSREGFPAGDFLLPAVEIVLAFAAVVLGSIAYWNWRRQR